MIVGKTEFSELHVLKKNVTRYNMDILRHNTTSFLNQL